MPSKKTTKKSAKKVLAAKKKVAAKKATAKKLTVKKVASILKKTSAKKSTSKKKTATVKPKKVVGGAEVRAVDDPGQATTKSDNTTVAPYLDENGVLVMVVQTN